MWLEYQLTLKLQKLKFINNSTKLFKPLSIALSVPVSHSVPYNGALWSSLADRKRAAFHSQPRHTAERKMSPLSERVSASHTSPTSSPWVSGSQFYSSFSSLCLDHPNNCICHFLSPNEFGLPRCLSNGDYAP